MESVALVGLNHQTAPVALRERLPGTRCDTEDFDPPVVPAIACGKRGVPGIDGYVELSTCNRLEVYETSEAPAAACSTLEGYMAARLDLPLEELRPHLYLLQDRAAVEHLMRLAAGAGSMILGEPQILGQVAKTAAAAREAGTDGPVLRQLFGRAVRAGKRARSETPIGRHTTSVSHAAVRLARDSFGELRDARVLVVGAGEMAEQAALALRDEGARHLTCLNRTYDHAERLAHRFEGSALGWGHLSEALAAADVVVTATGAPHTVIYREDMALALAAHEGRALVVVDIAVPRDVAPDVRNLPGVRYYDIDDVQSAVDANRAHREAALPQVETIVQQEADDFFRWLHGREVVPALVELRRNVESMVQAELDLMVRRLDGPDPRTREVMALLAHRIAGKFLHEPTVRLKAEAAQGNGEVYAEVLRQLFGLHGAADPDADQEQETPGAV